MRVLHVTPSVGPLRGGPSIALEVMAHAVRDAGIAVDVATTNDNDRELLQVPLGVPVDKGGVRYWYFARSARPYTTSTGLARWLRAHIREYDVIHTHALFSFSTPIAATLARRSGKPYVIRPLGTLARYGMQQHPMLKQLSWMLFEKKLLARAAAIHFTSEAERTEAERLGEWRSVVVPIGVEIDELFAPTHFLPDDQLVFLFLSRIHPKKRLDLVLHAVAEARRSKPRIRLIVAGDGERAYVDQMHALSDKLMLTDIVQWTGHISGTEKTRLLQRAHAFVLPSENENFGIAVAEALAAGLPVIVTRGVAIHCEVEAANAGLIVDSDAASVSAALLAMRDDATRARMSAQARALARSTFSIEAMQRGLIRMYEQVTTS